MGQRDRSDLQGFMNRLLSRSVLTREEQDAVFALPCHAVQISANRDFVGLGESIDHISLIVAGLVGRFDQNSEGSRQITAIHLPGDVANLHSVVQPQATSALQALSIATILRIPHSAVRAATARHPALAEVLWRDCMVDAAILSQWVVNVGRRDAKSRVAHLLCEVATRLDTGDGRNAFSFPFAVTQKQLADATGLTPVHVNRVVQALRQDSLADLRKQEAIIHDWAGLMEAGDFDPDYLQRRNTPEQRLRIVPAA